MDSGDTPIAGAPPERSRSLSELLQDLADDNTREQISVGDLLGAMRDRAFGALLFVFAVPNCLPGPPGTSTVLGAPLVFLALQLMLGLKPWLPGFITRRALTREAFAALIGRVNPWLIRAERALRPRLAPLVRGRGENVIGFVCLVMATILVLPIPLGNMFPAFCISVIALGLLARDGGWVLVGYVLSALSVGFVAGMMLVIWRGAFALARGTMF